MVKGLDRLREHFREFSDHYVLIGGTACYLAFVQAGLEFRSTKELDIVLTIESLDAEFAKVFWEFVGLGGYEIQESPAGVKKFYRFKKPKDKACPAMLELFARASDTLTIPEGSTQTRVAMAGDDASLSANLLDPTYYAWIQGGKAKMDGLPTLRTEHLILLKARAWMDLRTRELAGQKVDSSDVTKHKNDVCRLVDIVDLAFRVKLAAPMDQDMKIFCERVQADPPDFKSLGLNAGTMEKVLSTLRALYGL